MADLEDGNAQLYTSITDDVTANSAGVTPASTAVTAVQRALVVGLSPNSPLPTGANTIGGVTQSTSPWIVKDNADGSVAGGAAGTFSQLGGGIFNTVLPTLTNGQQASLQLTTNGALEVQLMNTLPLSVSPAVGFNWPVIGTLTNNNAAPAANNLGVLPAVAQSTINAAKYTNGDQVLLVTDLAGNINEDLQYVGGTAVVTAGVAGLLAIGGNVAAGSADAGNGVKSSGVYNTGVPVLTNGDRGDFQVDSRSYQIVTTAGPAATYTAAFTGLVPAAAATDIMTLTGSATKVVRVTKVVITATQTNQSVIEILLIKRSAANTGGTSTTPTAVPHDSNDAAATATIRGYTANPTALGAAVGTLVSRRAWVGQVAPGGNLSPVENGVGVVMYEAMRPCKPMILRGAAQVLAVNLNGVTVLGGSYGMHIEWTEE